MVRGNSRRSRHSCGLCGSGGGRLGRHLHVLEVLGGDGVGERTRGDGGPPEDVGGHGGRVATGLLNDATNVAFEFRRALFD